VAASAARAYDELQKARTNEEREAVVRKALASLAVNAQARRLYWREAAPLLAAALAPRYELEERRFSEKVAAGREPFPIVPAGAYVAYALVLKETAVPRLVTFEDLSNWNVTLNDARQRAIANLRRGPALHLEPVTEGAYVSEVNDAGVAAEFLNPASIRALPLKGAPVVLIPNDAVMLVADASNPSALLFMARRYEYYGSVTGFQPCPAMLLKDGKWRTFAPTRPPAVRAKFLGIRQSALAEWHGRQVPLLEKFFAARRQDTQVAPFKRGTTRAGQPVTWTRWQRGATVCLPIADFVIFVDGDRLLASAPWARVREVLGERLQATEFYPTRFIAAR